jgi:pimeloyl-ACP methyl ester carboxylesterase
MIHYHETKLVPAIDIVPPDFESEHRVHHLESGVRLNTITADGRKNDSDPTFIATLPWSEFVTRPDAADRYAIIADELDARVIAVDNLGVNGRSRIPRTIARDIRQGNFDGLSSVQWEALHEIDTNLGQTALSLFGYSLGGTVAMSLAKNAPTGIHFDSLLMAETVGVKSRSPRSLGRAFLAEMKEWEKYWPENPEWMHGPKNDPKMIGRIATHLPGHIYYPLGLSRGTLLQTVEDAYGKSIDSTTKVHVMSGEMSIVSPISDNLLLASKFIEIGVEQVSMNVFLGESHGMIDSVNRLVPALETAFFNE